jgi:hypothetical protein
VRHNRRRAPLRERRRLGCIDVRGVHDAPARIDVEAIEQPLHRARAVRAHAVVDFGRLLGDVDMHGRIVGHAVEQRTQAVLGHRAQRMRRDAVAQPAMLGRDATHRVEQFEQAVRRVDEAALVVARRLVAEAGELVGHRQHRDSDAGRARRVDHARAEFRDLRIARTVLRVMHVMEFAHRRIAALEHLDVQPARDRRERVGRDLQREAVHQVAPAPEAVGGIRAVFGEPRHRALERVRMQVRHAGQHGPGRARRARRRVGIGAHAGQRAGGVPAQQHVAAPAVGQVCMVREQRRFGHRQCGPLQG